MPPRTFPCGSSLTRLRLLRRCLTTRRWAAISPAPVPRQLRSKHSPLLRSRPTAKMGPPGRPVNWRRPFRSRLATNFNVPLGRPTGRPRSTTGARQRWQRLRRVRPLVRRGAMHVRALAGGVAPFARPPTALPPSAQLSLTCKPTSSLSNPGAGALRLAPAATTTRLRRSRCVRPDIVRSGGFWVGRRSVGDLGGWVAFFAVVADRPA